MILLAAVFILAGGSYAAEEFTPIAPDVVVTSESAAGVSVTISIPSPTLSVLDRGESGQALRVEIPGALPDFDEVGLALPTITKFVAVPAGYRAVAHLNATRETSYDAEALVARDNMSRAIRSLTSTPTVEVGEAGWMRWLRIAPVVISPARYDAETHTLIVADQLDLSIEFVRDETDNVPAPDPERYWSLAYEQFFRGILINPDNLPDIQQDGKVVTRGSYVIVTDQDISRVVGDFATWKKEKGFDVVVKPIVYVGMEADELLDSIRTWYTNWDRPPEYILLLGDSNKQNMRLPTFYIKNPERNEPPDPTDLPYSCLEGDDYFPDLFLGRISCDSPAWELAVVGLARSVLHEQNVGSYRPGQFHRATIWAGNFSDGGVAVYSPVETSEWLAERLRERDWDVETFYYRGDPGDNISSDPIVESMNRGINIASYRGWADANGSHYPQFYRGDLDRLQNSPLLPIFTTFVCNTGDFDNNDVDPCFGEKAITRGTRPTPFAALGFYGPSDLHTNTRFNNSMLGNYYFGLLNEGQNTLATAVLRAKMGVWAANPRSRHMGGDGYFVQFYFSVYNILGDPEVTLYMDEPSDLAVEHPDHLAVGESSMRFHVTANGQPVRGALIHLAKPNETDVSILTDADGIAFAPVNLLTPDSLQVTILAYKAAPYRAWVPVRASARMIGFDHAVVRNQQGDARLDLGVPSTVTVSLKNFGSEAIQGVTASLEAPMAGVTVSEGAVLFGDMAVGATVEGQSSFHVQLDRNVPPDATIPFVVHIQDRVGNIYTALFRQPIVAPRLGIASVELQDGAINPGEQKSLILTISNTGTANAVGVTGVIETYDDAVTIVDADGSFGQITVNQSVNCRDNPFVLSVNNEAAIGRQIAFRLHLFSEGASVGWYYFNITVGRPGPTDPVGPDGYGYYAYDNTDTRYDAHPEYSWIELDPAFGGTSDAHFVLEDDTSVAVQLPFSFNFYGQSFRGMTVCANGWLSFDESLDWDFNNWPLPSPLGPHSMVCPYWEDLVGPMIPDSGKRDSIDVFARYDQPEGRFIVEWSRSIARTGNDVEVIQTFEVILYDPSVRQTPTGDGEIMFQYFEARLVDKGKDLNYATIGIQDWEHNQGLQLSFAAINAVSCDTITGGRAILITTTPPDRFHEVDGNGKIIPTLFALSEPFPNPFNARTSVSFDLPTPSDVRLGLFDLNGRLVQEVVAGRYVAGTHSIEFSAQDLSSGLYFLRLDANGQSAQRKIALIK